MRHSVPTELVAIDPKATLCERLIPHCERFNWRNGNYGISPRDQTGPVAKCAELRRNRVQTNLELCSGPRAGGLLQLLSAKWEVLPGGHRYLAIRRSYPCRRSRQSVSTSPVGVSDPW